MVPSQFKLGLFLALFLLGNLSVSNSLFAPAKEYPNIREFYGYSGACGSLGGIPNIDNYIQWRLTNFSTWAAHDSRLPNTVLLANKSNNSITNLLFRANVTFVNTSMNGVVENAEPTCVKADLERGQITVVISYSNSTFKGHYAVNGTLLKSLPIMGNGSWEMDFDIKCTLETYFSFNTTNNKMELVMDNDDSFESGGSYSHCGVDYGPQSYPSSRIGYWSGGQKSPYSKFEGSLGQKIPESLQMEIKRVMASHISPDLHRTLLLPVTEKIQPVLLDYLSTILKEKTILEMIDFEIIESPDCFHRLLSGKRLAKPHVLKSVSAKSFLECQDACIRESNFSCRSVSYRYMPSGVSHSVNSVSNCELSPFYMNTANTTTSPFDFLDDYDYDHFQTKPYCRTTTTGGGGNYGGTIPLRGECSNTAQCKGDHVECRVGMCRCALGFFPPAEKPDLCQDASTNKFEK